MVLSHSKVKIKHSSDNRRVIIICVLCKMGRDVWLLRLRSLCVTANDCSLTGIPSCTAFSFIFVCIFECFSHAPSASWPFGWYLPTLVGIIHQIPECHVIKAVWCPLSLAVLALLAKRASRAKSPVDLLLLISLTAKILSCGYQMKRVQPYFFKDQPI